MSRKACVVGAGPNGLAAAIVLAQAGFDVSVFEAEPTPGGAVRTLPLTVPGFLHDFGSAVHPWVVGSPFFSTLPLNDYGLEWIHSPAPLAHPLDDGTAVMLERDLSDAATSLGVDGKAWRRLVGPFVEHWQEFAPEILQPVHLFTRHPWLMARFGLSAFRSAESLAASAFRDQRTRALFAGMAAHSFLRLDDTLSGAFGILLAVSAHAVGWPIPGGGSQSITNALCGHLAKLGGKVKTSRRIESLEALREYDVTLCDLTPRQLVRIAGSRLSNQYRQRLEKYRYGPAAFKVDYALSQPIPWKARECERAATVHLGGSFGEIAASEKAMATGQPPERPFMILAQPSLFDPSRAPSGKHTVWAYCHVPNGSRFDMLPRMEAQIERFAPGFSDCVLARKVFSPSDLENMDANLVGGDIGGGAMDLRQFLFRPTRLQYATSAEDIYLCSASTPPGGGVHGMCGYHAARLAVSRMKG
ncbi:MAG TPA: NAD(P)/FAD-dependent oxidoreductase [Terriglobales bacterium]|jgi:phytoene dehydrogenase-like protein|nr:NAD(P)/FAD-dependent oxidoreductase [Terriglobales bacterium]